MTTAVDTSVILDVLADDSRFAGGSIRALTEARRTGRLIVCETVIAEITPALDSEEEVSQLLAEWSLEFVASNLEVAVLAGANYRRYLQSGGVKKRIVPDFLIGAHARKLADRLLARDRGYLRDYFSDLSVVDPCS